MLDEFDGVFLFEKHYLVESIDIEWNKIHMKIRDKHL